MQTTSPDFTGYDDLSVFVIDGEHIKSQPSTWDALGLRGNQSGPIEVDDVEIPADADRRARGRRRRLQRRVGRSVVPDRLLVGAGTGIAIGAIDIAKRQTTRKRHVDVGLRVADYPTIQDYVGEAMMDTNACRLFAFSVAQAMDDVDRPQHQATRAGRVRPRQLPALGVADQVHAAKNTAHVVDKMLHACGGTGYKRDMELERYLRDAKAGWVMGPTNEVLRQFVGKAVAARLRQPRLLEPDVQPPRGRERGQEARRRRQAQARRGAARRGR